MRTKILKFNIQMKKVFRFSPLFLLLITSVFSQEIQRRGAHDKVMVVERKRPAEWNNLVFGGRFMDLFLPMPDLGGMTSNTWGAPGTVPRDVNNGIEDSEWSYWGGNTRLLEDGKYHSFIARWPEGAEGGHMAWPLSEVVHVVADNPYGPFKVVGKRIGPGHNPEWYISKQGNFVIYVIDGGYIANDINGPWEKFKFKYNDRDRKPKKVAKNYLHNNTFAKREDGSFIMVNRHGQVWFSKDGEGEWGRITKGNIYPSVPGKYEDPVIWRDHVQYHVTVNDWLGRIAWHLRSKNGVNWKVDAGEAYVPGITHYKNGIKEQWHKYERPKVIQDKYGRAIAMNLAVLDTLKYSDLPNDNHSSKWISVPLNKGCLVETLTKKRKAVNSKIKIKILAEKDFNPHTDIDLKSLRFGAPEVVDYGKGSTLLSTKKVGEDLILVFSGKGNGFTNENFAGKLLGKTIKGNLLYGYSKLPWVNCLEPILSARKPQITEEEEKYAIAVEVQNFGQVISKKTSIRILAKVNGIKKMVVKGTIPTLKPFEKVVIKLSSKKDFKIKESTEITTRIESKNQKPIILITPLKK